MPKVSYRLSGMIVNEATKNAMPRTFTIVPEGVNEEADVVMLLQDGKDEHDDDEDEDNTDSNRVDSDTPSPARGRAVGTFIDRKTFLTFSQISLGKVIAGAFSSVVRSHSKILVACVQQTWKYLSTERFYAVARSEHAACRSIASPSAKSSLRLAVSWDEKAWAVG